MLFQNKVKNGSISIRITRDSVSMGDDCMAPHKSEMIFKSSDTLTDLMRNVAEYVPPVSDFEWKIMCGSDVIGRLKSGTDTKYKITLEYENIAVSSLSENEIFCQKVQTGPVSYFERTDLIYDGTAFSLNGFREYGSISTVLQKEETMICTSDKEFALRHGFIPNEYGTYNKLLPIELFEGLIIYKIPNNIDEDTIREDIPKEKIREELKKRIKTPSDMITDGILSNEVNIGRFVFEEAGYTVFIISDSSDETVIYQISKEDYQKLLPMSCKDKIPDSPVSSITTDACRKKSLCGERSYCSSDDADLIWAEKIYVSDQPEKKKTVVMNFCPECGRKNDGSKYCRDCGAKLLKQS